jgi:hypothetical protein
LPPIEDFETVLWDYQMQRASAPVRRNVPEKVESDAPEILVIVFESDLPGNQADFDP